jgi:hypothetical protein
MIDEEAIFAALFERVSAVRWLRAGDDPAEPRQFITASRRVRLFADVPSNQQPACFQAEWATDEQQVTNQPYKTTLMANWVIFQCVGKDKKAIGAIENNLIIGGCRKALAPLPADPGYPDKRNTLNGLVHHCFISGRIFKDPGDIDDQGMIVIPIKLLVP